MQVPLSRRAARLISRAVLRAAAASGVIACFAPSESHATFTVDLRAVSATGASSVVDPKHVRVGAAGDVISFELWGLIQGQDTDPSNDGVNNFVGSFVTPNTGGGTLRADVSARAVDANFVNNGHSIGLLTDLDGDGDLDVGSNNDVSAQNFFAGRSINAPNILPGATIQLATMSLTVTQLAGGPPDSTSAVFRIRQHSLAASWFEDGTFVTAGNGPGFLQGAPVQLEVIPEPTALACALLTLPAPLLARRRK